ncbi:MAG: hypothetical protein GC185_01945 [Alphaproteobacteria bacterium]|nr:hypothetical protein [Alphaproteobacteria bacterium]
MKVLTLKDDRGQMWRDFAVIIEEGGQWSEGYYRRQAEKKLFSDFAEEWFGRRFPHKSDGFAQEVGKTLLLNGWSIYELEVRPCNKNGGEETEKKGGAS